jgi:hypothetical protein
MSKKTGGNSLHSFGGMLALISVFITGGIFLINLILGLFDGSFDAGLLNTISSIAMLVSIVIVSWASLSKANLPGNKTVWYLFYWAFVVLAFAGQINF